MSMSRVAAQASTCPRGFSGVDTGNSHGSPSPGLFDEKSAQNYYDVLTRTAENVSPLYLLDAFDLVVLGAYFSLLALLSVYGAYRVKQVIDFWRYRPFAPLPKALYAESALPRVTVQLPLYNEAYVVERLLAAVAALDYPRARLEVQVLDDSTDETRDLARAAVARLRARGLDAAYVHRDDRSGFKAGALEAGLRTAKGELLAIFDADFVPRPQTLRTLVHFFNDPLVACAQMRWSHITAARTCSRASDRPLDGHSSSTNRSQSHGGFFNFNGTAGMWRRRAIELSAAGSTTR